MAASTSSASSQLRPTVTSCPATNLLDHATSMLSRPPTYLRMVLLPRRGDWTSWSRSSWGWWRICPFALYVTSDRSNSTCARSWRPSVTLGVSNPDPSEVRRGRAEEGMAPEGLECPACQSSLGLVLGRHATGSLSSMPPGMKRENIARPLAPTCWLWILWKRHTSLTTWSKAIQVILTAVPCIHGSLHIEYILA